MKKLALTVLWLVAAPAAAQAPKVPGACVNVQAAAVAGRFSGMDLQAFTPSFGGLGIIINRIDVSDPATYAIRTSAAQILDQNFATITPFTFPWGSPLSFGILETVREGTAGAAAGEGAFVFVGNGTTLPRQGIAPFFLPAGSFLTVTHQVANTATSITVCFTSLR